MKTIKCFVKLLCNVKGDWQLWTWNRTVIFAMSCFNRTASFSAASHFFRHSSCCDTNLINSRKEKELKWITLGLLLTRILTCNEQRIPTQTSFNSFGENRCGANDIVKRSNKCCNRHDWFFQGLEWRKCAISLAKSKRKTAREETSFTARPSCSFFPSTSFKRTLANQITPFIELTWFFWWLHRTKITGSDCLNRKGDETVVHP